MRKNETFHVVIHITKLKTQWILLSAWFIPSMSVNLFEFFVRIFSVFLFFTSVFINDNLSGQLFCLASQVIKMFNILRICCQLISLSWAFYHHNISPTLIWYLPVPTHQVVVSSFFRSPTYMSEITS